MVDYLNNVKKPFSDIKTLIIGIVLSAIPLVNLLVSGYVLKVAEDTIKGKKGLREFAVGDVVEYIVKWFLSIVISFIYMIIPLILIGFGVGGAIGGLLADPMALSDPMAAAGIFSTALAAGGIFIVVGGILGIIAAILLPMAQMKWLKNGSLGAAFNIPEVVKNALTANYIITIVVALVYGIIVMAIAGVLAGILAITIIGPLVVAGFASFILNVAIMSMYAETVN